MKIGHAAQSVATFSYHLNPLSVFSFSQNKTTCAIKSTLKRKQQQKTAESRTFQAANYILSYCVTAWLLHLGKRMWPFLHIVLYISKKMVYDVIFDLR